MEMTTTQTQPSKPLATLFQLFTKSAEPKTSVFHFTTQSSTYMLQMREAQEYARQLCASRNIKYFDSSLVAAKIIHENKQCRLTYLVTVSFIFTK